MTKRYWVDTSGQWHGVASTTTGRPPMESYCYGAVWKEMRLVPIEEEDERISAWYELLEQNDERISAWYELLKHPFFAEAQAPVPEGEDDPPLLEKMRAALDDAMHPKTVALPEVKELHGGGYEIAGQPFALEQSADQYELDARAFEERARRHRAAARFVREREAAKKVQDDVVRSVLDDLVTQVSGTQDVIGAALAGAIINAIEEQIERVGR